MKKIASILKLLLVVSLLIGGIGSDVVLADSYETDSINVVGANASNQIELGTIGADGKNVAATNRARKDIQRGCEQGNRKQICSAGI